MAQAQVDALGRWERIDAIRTCVNKQRTGVVRACAATCSAPPRAYDRPYSGHLCVSPGGAAAASVPGL